MYTSQFQTMQPDYILEEIDLKPDKSINFALSKNQTQYNLAGKRKCAFNLSNFHEAKFSFSLNNLTEIQKNTLLDFYCNEYKANGKGKSIIYNHPIYDESFVCKFDSSLKDFFDRNERYSFSAISLSIIGTDRNLISTSTWTSGSPSATGYVSLGVSGEDLSYSSIWDYSDVLDYSEIL